MDLRIATPELKRALTLAKGIVPKSSGMAVLTNLLVEATASGLVRFTAFDLDVAVIIEASGEVKKPGNALLPVSLHEFVLSFKDDEVVREPAQSGGKGKGKKTVKSTSTVRMHTMQKTTGMSTTVEYGNTTTRFSAFGSPDDFPKLPQLVDNAKAFDFHSATLVEMISRTIHSVSKDPQRVNITGVNLQRVTTKARTSPVFRMAATDGFRVACFERELGDFELPKGGITIPQHAASKLVQLIQADPGEGWTITVGKENNRGAITVGKGKVRMVVRLVDGVFAEYEKLLPSKLPPPFHIETVLLRAAVERMAIVGNPVVFQLKGQELLLSARDPEMGDCAETIGVSYKGREVRASFDPKFIQEALEQVGTERVTCWLSVTEPPEDYEAEEMKPAGQQNHAPCCFRPEGSEEFYELISQRR